MNDILRPIEQFLHGTLDPAGWWHAFFFSIFKFLHLNVQPFMDKFLWEYPDYLFFGLTAVPLFYLVPKRARVGYLLLASFLMIAMLYGLIYAAGLLAIPIVSHGLVKRWQARALEDPIFRRRAITGMVSTVLAIYALLLAREFFDWRPVLPMIDRPLYLPLLHIAGVAFMLPKLIHYIVDGLKGEIRDAKLSHFLLFMLFFPIFRLGPIERFQSFERDILRNRHARVSPFDIAYGLSRIAIGVIKTLIFTGVLYPWRLYGAENLETISWGWLQLMVIAGIFDVYFHFGGYTDIANGFSRLLGFRMMENFFFPIFSRNIGEMWRRWHISLSFWLRDYVFIPLGGSRRNGVRNALITFFICGAWHELELHYIVWGTMQGVALAVLAGWKRFWYRVARTEGYHDALKPVQGWMRAHPRTAMALGIFITMQFFGLSGWFFVLDVERGLIAVTRYLTLGIYPAP